MSLILKCLNFFRRHRKKILLSMAAATLTGGWWIYFHCYEGMLSGYQAFYYAFALFALDVKQPVEIGITQAASCWRAIYLPAFLGIVTTMGSILGFALEVLKTQVENLRVRLIQKNQHTVIAGLGANNRMYLQSEFDSRSQNPRHPIIIIEPNITDPIADYYTDMGFGLVRQPAEECKFAFYTMERIVISTGNDLRNFEILRQIVEQFLEKEEKKENPRKSWKIVFHIHLNNHDLLNLFYQRVFNNADQLRHFVFKPFNFYDNVARSLLMQHTIFGHFDPNGPLQIALVGDGKLVERCIYHLTQQTVSPFEHPVTVHLVAEKAHEVYARILCDYPAIERLKHLQIQCHPLTPAHPEFITKGPWLLHRLSYVIIAFDHDDKNLECAVNLYEKCYFADAVSLRLKTKVMFALFNNRSFAKIFDNDKEAFRTFFSFGYAGEINNRNNIIEEENEKLAKLIHFGYGVAYDPKWLINETMWESVEEKWQRVDHLFKRESNRSQALHVTTKLAAIEFEMQAVKPEENLSSETLLELNRKILFRHFDLDENKLEKEIHILQAPLRQTHYDSKSFNDCFDAILNGDSSVELAKIAHLIQSEHRRWMVFYKLHGWRQDNKTVDVLKTHENLCELGDFSTTQQKAKIIYDIFAILYIPNYLASAKLKIVPLPKISIPSTEDLI